MLTQNELNEMIRRLIDAVNASSVVNDYNLTEASDVQKAKQAFDALYKKIGQLECPAVFSRVYNETMHSKPEVAGYELAMISNRTMVYRIQIGKIVKQLNTDFKTNMSYTGSHLSFEGTPLLSPVGSDVSSFVYSARFTRTDNPITNHQNYHLFVQIMSSRVTQMLGVVLFLAGLALIQSSTLGVSAAAIGVGILACSFFTKYCPGTRPYNVISEDLDNNFQSMQPG